MSAESGSSWGQEVFRGAVRWIVPKILDWILPTILALALTTWWWWQQMPVAYWTFAAIVWLIVFLLVRESRAVLSQRGAPTPTYTTRELMEGVHIESVGLGPHIYITAGSPYSLGPVRLAVFNRLAMPIELESFTLEIRISSRKFGAWQHLEHQTIDAHALGVLLVTYELNDNHAVMLREYQRTTNGDECPVLTADGRAHFKSSIATFDVGFHVETRGFIYKRRGDDE